MRLMKYYIIIVVAGLSFLLAIPFTKTPTSPIAHTTQIHLEAKQVVAKVALPPAAVQPAVPTPAPSLPKPTVVAASYKCAAYENYFKQYDWNTNTAMAICQAESGGNPNPPNNAAINYDGISDFGLMQLHGINIIDPAANISYAYYHKYLTQGWRAWNAYKNGTYQQFL